MHALIDLSGSRNDPGRRTGRVDLRVRLKEATAEAHRQLDRSLLAFDLRTVAGYRRFLEANAGALLPLEAALVESGVDEIVADWSRRSRTDAILDDLTRIDGKLHLMPAPASLSHSRLLGVMYVLEGSRLGARFLLKLVARSADPAMTGATAYLSHGSAEPLWERFLLLLAHEAPRVEEEEVVAGARTAFGLFSMAAAGA
ncbi:biliverdin-producing heme oxygenase [Bradyrhizobium sp. SYSU BS000235]|uniref:biliverdin-producing heme oxygenase n=1 Tax=Bradyrhizobium sp. SYSU BS000235 TaxID=3411332 RepID=UPI003C78FC0E